jgi:glucose/arabinose dehydrogenase/putative cell wall-binding protein
LTGSVVQGGAGQLQFTWDIAFLPSGEMLVTERAGRVRVYASGAYFDTLVRTITVPNVRAQGEAGLMGIAVDVDFAANPYVYLCASRDLDGAGGGAPWENEVLRYTIAPNGTWSGLTVLLSDMTAGTNHNGCAVEMDSFGLLWVTMGDAGIELQAQDPDDMNGKILRMHRDGSVPAGNPTLPGAAGQTVAYSMGHRNPQGIAFQPGTGRVYAAEHGPNTDDEVNLIESGFNYGWPCRTGAADLGPSSGNPACNAGQTFRPPVWESNSPTIAPSNLAFAQGSAWGDWEGHLFVAQLKEQDLRRNVLSGAGTSVVASAIHFNATYGRLRAVVLGPGGHLYLSTSNGPSGNPTGGDRIIRVSVRASRIAGPDRYATAAAISAAHFSPGAPVAYVATGLNFPDALAGSAAAAHAGGPVLLVTTNGIPAATAAELGRLNPGTIRVLGGPGAVSNGVMAALDPYTAGPVVRLWGPDRYSTAAAISAATFSPGVDAAFVATGTNFPDALSGGAAAGHLDGPLLLTNAGTLPLATAAELGRLNPDVVYVLGGAGVVSNAVAAAIGSAAGAPVTRLSGADRYATATAISSNLWTTSDAVYVTTGLNFPDGVAGGAAAAVMDAPVLLVHTNGVPVPVIAEVQRLEADRVVILGGSGVVSNTVMSVLAGLLEPN